MILAPFERSPSQLSNGARIIFRAAHHAEIQTRFVRARALCYSSGRYGPVDTGPYLDVVNASGDEEKTV